jgi:hypothetical protein
MQRGPEGSRTAEGTHRRAELRAMEARGTAEDRARSSLREPRVQVTHRQPQRAPEGAPVHQQRHRPEQTTRYRLVKQHAATFFAQAQAEAGADLQQFVQAQYHEPV